MTNWEHCVLCGSKDIATIIDSEVFKILECRNCEIAYTDPCPLLPEYEKMDFHSKGGTENFESLTSITGLPEDWQKLIKLQVEMITNKFKKDINILEIGCGEGLLLDELKKKGFTSIDGIEPSKTAALRAQKRGLNITNLYFNKNVVDKNYDLIVMSHVFEHIPKLIEFLDELKEVIQEKGCLMFTQTTFKGLIPRWQKENWYAWVPEQHYWHFTPKGLSKLLVRNGFKQVSSSFTSLVHPHNLAYKIAELKESFKDQFIAIFQKDV